MQCYLFQMLPIAESMRFIVLPLKIMIYCPVIIEPLVSGYVKHPCTCNMLVKHKTCQHCKYV